MRDRCQLGLQFLVTSHRDLGLFFSFATLMICQKLLYSSLFTITITSLIFIYADDIKIFQRVDSNVDRDALQKDVELKSCIHGHRNGSYALIWYSVLPDLDVTINCHIKKTVRHDS